MPLVIPWAILINDCPVAEYYYHQKRRAHLEEVEGVPDPADTPARQRLGGLVIAHVAGAEAGRKCRQQSSQTYESLS